MEMAERILAKAKIEQRNWEEMVRMLRIVNGRDAQKSMGNEWEDVEKVLGSKSRDERGVNEILRPPSLDLENREERRLRKKSEMGNIRKGGKRRGREKTR